VYDFSSGALCLDFANTWGNRNNPSTDRLSGYGDLDLWGRQGCWFSNEEGSELDEADRPGEKEATWHRALELRDAIYRIFSSRSRGAGASDLGVLNRELTVALPHLRLRCREGSCYWEWSSKKGSADWMLWPVCRSAAELLTSEQWDRVKECTSNTCTYLFIDSSRNRTRKWCDMATCGNRAKAHRFYARHSG
jgi:predicted RNA-binding Zn ribbon-like protein